MAYNCTKPKWPRNSAWFKEKTLLAKALESRVVLDEEQMAFLVDNAETVTTGQESQEIPTPTIFQTMIWMLFTLTHDALSVIDNEETLELVEESGLKMHAKQNDPIAKEKKVNIAPIDYVALNKLFEHFVKHFVP
nr:hypothetical protein [Tanacetum cinerariifolium]